MSTATPPARGWPDPLFRRPTHEDLPCGEGPDPPPVPIPLPFPTHNDLPETDGKPVENTYQHPQSVLLSLTLGPVLDRLHPDGNYLAGTGTAIYWLMTKDPLEGCKAPDWYYVPNVPPRLGGEFRRSYVLWEELAHPLLLVEYVSRDGADEHDDTPGWGKFWVYERAIKAAYYAIWDPDRGGLEVFELVRGRYRPVPADPAGRFPIPPMELSLGVWHGRFLANEALWLRAWGANGVLIPTPEELNGVERRRAEAERSRADAAQRQADVERQAKDAATARADAEAARADALAAKLRELGVDPDAV